MPTVKNMSYGPLSLTLADQSTLTLGAREVAEISQDDFAQLAVHPHFTERRVAVLPAGVTPPSSSRRRAARPFSPTTDSEGF